MIKKPPQFPHDHYAEVINEGGIDLLHQYMSNFGNIKDSDGRYSHFDKFIYKVKSPFKPELAWAFMKFSRNISSTSLFRVFAEETTSTFVNTDLIQVVASKVDRLATADALSGTLRSLEKSGFSDKSLHDGTLMESISSSQLEGAATTTLVAKQLLKSAEKGRSKSGADSDMKMILGNFKLMNLAWESRNDDISIDLLLSFHKMATEDIDDESYRPGEFRNTDDVVVQGRDGEVIHVPPVCSGIKLRLDALFQWINKDHNRIHEFIHPLVKASVIHFMIGYEHPFNDGNGRVARALFYWFMFKSGYSAFRYISISEFLKKAPAKYAKSYLYCETDDYDLTYFIEYQCHVVNRALESFIKYRDSLMIEINAVKAGESLSVKEAEVLALMRTMKINMRLVMLESYVNYSRNTVLAVAKSLSEKGYLIEIKIDGSKGFKLADHSPFE